MKTTKFFSAACIMGSLIWISNISDPIQKENTKVQEILTVEKFSQQDLIAYLKELKVKYPHIVLAQAKLETGNFTSLVFEHNNNLFGMKQAKSRATTCKGTSFNHAKYDSWKDSVLDYALYSSKHIRASSEKEYMECLSKTYAEDEKYVDKLSKIIEKENLKTLFP